MGHKQTCRDVRVTSALPPIADIRRMSRHVRYVPLADITHRHELRYNAITLWHYGGAFFGGASS
jgi:hypothetical protein